METKKKNEFLIQGTILAIASILVRFIGIIYRIPLQRMLGDKGMGYYSTAYEIYAIMLIISSYSLPTAISKLVSTRVTKKEYKNAYKIFLGGLLFAAVSGTLAAALTYILAGPLASFFKFNASVYALRALAPTLVLVAFMGVFRGYLQGFNTTIPTAISQIIEKIVQVTFSLILCYVMLKNAVNNPDVIKEAKGAMGATLGNAIGALLALAFLIFVFLIFKPSIDKRIKKQNDANEETFLEILKLLILTIIPVLLSTTVNNISNITDNFIVGNILHIKGFSKDRIAILWGILSNKYRTIIALPVSVASALAVSTMPSMSAAIAVNNTKEALNKISMAVRFICVFSIPCAVGVMILANPILQLLFYDGTTYNAIGTYLLWIGSCTVILSSLVAITNSILQGLGHLKLPVIHCAIGLIVHILFAVVFMGLFNFSIYAIVIAEIALMLTTLILNYRFLIINYDYRQELKKTFLIPLVSSVIMGGIVSLTYHLLALITSNRGLLVLIPMFFALIAYSVSMVLLKGISKEDLEQMPKGHLILKLFKKIHLMN